MNAEGLTIAAGSVAFIGNFAEEGGWPTNGYKIVGATIALAIIFSFAGNGPLSKPVTALAALMLLAAVYRYVPAFRKKGK